MLSEVALLFSFIASAVALFVASVRSLGWPRDRLVMAAAAAFGLGPACLGWLLHLWLVLFPGRADSVYIALNAATCGFCFVYGRRHFADLKQALSQAFERLRKFRADANGLEWVLLLAVALVVLLTWFRSIAFPVYENDPLDYLNIGRLIYDQKSTAHYPLIDAATNRGFYNVTCHPLGYASLIVWGFMIHGGSDYYVLYRIVSPYYVTAAALFFLACLSVPRLVRLFWAALVFSAPFFVLCGMQREIDVYRIYLFIIPFFCLRDVYQAPRSKSLRTTFAYGCLCGLALFAHSAGLLLLPFLGFALITSVRSESGNSPWAWKALWRKIQFGALIGLIMTAVGGWQYFKNYRIFGSIINYALPFYRLAPLKIVESYRAQLGITDVWGRLFNGALGALTWVDEVGIVFWLFLLVLAAAAAKPLRNKIKYSQSMCVCASVVLVYHLVDFLATFGGSDALIMNRRYIVMMVPFAAYFAAEGLVQTMQVLQGTRRRIVLTTTVGAVFAWAMVVRPAYAIVENTWDNFNMSWDGLMETDAQKVSRFDVLGHSIDWINEKASADSRVLTRAYNLLFTYSDRAVVRDEDPQMLAAALAPTTGEAYSELRKLGIDYVLLSDAASPAFMYSRIYETIVGPEYSELLDSFKGRNIYRLKKAPTPNTVRRSSMPFVPPSWSERDEDGDLPYGWESIGGGGTWREAGGKPFYEVSTTRVATEVGLRSSVPDWKCSKRSTIVGEQEFHLRVSARGEGQYAITVVEIRADGKNRAMHRISGILLEREGRQDLLHFRTNPEACDYSVSVSLVSPGRLTVDAVQMDRIERL